MKKEPKQKAAGSGNLGQWLAILTQIPAEIRIFGVALVIVELVLGAIIPFADVETRKYVALGMVAMGILCVLFVGTAQLFRAYQSSDTIRIPVLPEEERGGKITKFKYDVFVSAPIDALQSDPERSAQRQDILEIVDCIIKKCKLQNVYYAGDAVKGPSSYDQPRQGLLDNVQRIRASTYFVLIFPQLLPTSALVEVGMALALGKRSVWFIQKDASLPYLLREGGSAGGRADLPRINVFNYDKLKTILSIIDKDADQIFNFD